MADASVVAWGGNAFGECNVPAGFNFKQIVADNTFGMVLKSDGSLVAWGYNNYGQCNVPSGNLTLGSGAKMDYELGTPANSDEVSMSSGLLALNGQQFWDFNFTPLDGFGPDTYTLIDAASISGSLGPSTSGMVDGLPATLAIEGNDLVLTVVPEPATLALLGFAAVILLHCGWQRPRLTRMR